MLSFRKRNEIRESSAASFAAIVITVYYSGDKERKNDGRKIRIEIVTIKKSHDKNIKTNDLCTK